MFCYNKRGNECHYSNLGQYTAEHVDTKEKLISIYRNDPSLATEESYVLFNTTNPSDFVMTPTSLSVGGVLPCHMVGITPQSAITVDLRNWQSTWTSNLMFYNLSIEWIPGKDGTVTVDNMTYMGCKAWSDKSKAVNAHFIEVYTDCDLFSTFKSVETGYLNIYGDALAGDVTFKQSEYSHDWTGRHPDICTRVILNGEDANVVIGQGVTTITMASKRINISTATKTENRLIVEMNDMQRCSLSGTGLRIGVPR